MKNRAVLVWVSDGGLALHGIRQAKMGYNSKGQPNVKEAFGALPPGY